MTDLSRYTKSLGRILPVRHRYILTRRNTVRLRYKLGGAVLCIGLLAFLVLPAAVSALTDARGAVHIESGHTELAVQAVTDISSPAKGRDTKSLHIAAADDKVKKNRHKPRIQPISFRPAPARPKVKVIEIGSGDTLGSVLNDAGIGNRDVYKAVQSLKEFYDPRRIRPGQKLSVRYDPVDPKGTDYVFAGLEVEIDPLKSVALNLDTPDIFKAELIEKPAVKRAYAQHAQIELSLYGSGLKAGIPAAIISEAIRIYSWDVDFQRDIRHGDELEVLYEKIETEDGTPIKAGDVLYARLDVNGQDIAVYRYEMENGDIDYFTADGHSIRKALMATPIDGARLSSGYGLRKHPVLGYQKMHKGVDFAAPRGTPIYAAGDGTIEKMQRWGGYGNYVRIRHNSSLKTAYAHLKGFAPGLSAGTRVKQGQVIGYVGTTGRSTGPHLHYEVLQKGDQVNPRDIDLPQGESLSGSELANFKRHIQKVNRQYATLLKGTKYAALDR